MTKQNFIALADTMRDTKPSADCTGQAIQWEITVGALADFCQSQNPRFDRARWLGYIAGTNGPNGGTKVKAPCCVGVGFHSSDCPEVR